MTIGMVILLAGFGLVGLIYLPDLVTEIYRATIFYSPAVTKGADDVQD